MKQLILASSSPHRASLLRRLGLSFEIVAPDVDESPRDGELPHDLALRLARHKAGAVATERPEATVIGSDQVAVHEGRFVGKPGSLERAADQLEAFCGQTVQFLTAVAVIRERDELIGEAVVETRIEFRNLRADEIMRYLEADEPFDCAGSFKAESLGPALFDSAFSQDPTAIIGLPLIETARLLRMAGFQVP